MLKWVNTVCKTPVERIDLLTFLYPNQITTCNSLKYGYSDHFNSSIFIYWLGNIHSDFLEIEEGKSTIECNQFVLQEIKVNAKSKVGDLMQSALEMCFLTNHLMYNTPGIHSNLFQSIRQRNASIGFLTSYLYSNSSSMSLASQFELSSMVNYYYKMYMSDYIFELTNILDEILDEWLSEMNRSFSSMNNDWRLTVNKRMSDYTGRGSSNGNYSPRTPPIPDPIPEILPSQEFKKAKTGCVYKRLIFETSFMKDLLKKFIPVNKLLFHIPFP